MDDVNYLLAREQVSLLRASTATDPSARFAHREFARQYGLLLAGSSYPHRVSEETHVIEADGVAEDPTPRALARWVNEGGALP